MNKKQLRFSVLLLMALSLLLFSINSARCFAKSIDPGQGAVFLDRGKEFFNGGDFSNSTKAYKKAIKIFTKTGQKEHKIKAITALSQVYQVLGLYEEAERILLNIFKEEHINIESPALLTAKNNYANILIAQNRNDEAEAILTEAISAARKLNKKEQLIAHLLSTRGNLYVSTKNFAGAKRAYEEGIALCNTLDIPESCKAILQGNLARLMILKKDYKEALALLKSATTSYNALPDSYNKATGLTNIGVSYGFIIKDLPENYGPVTTKEHLGKYAIHAYNRAEKTANRLKESDLARSHIYGYKGHLFEINGRYNKALGLTRKAAFLAQSAESPVALYSWQWQTGRIFSAMGRVDDATRAYELAINTLKGIKKTLSAQCKAYTSISFTESIEPVYFGLADLLFQKVDRLGVQNEKSQSYLKKARSTIELLKTAQLQDYFNDPCVDAYMGKRIDINDVSQGTAVFYVISFPDKLELLFSTSTGIIRHTLSVKAEEFASEVYNLRKMLEKRTTRQYIPHARKLYDWLIRPFERPLVENNIDTIIMVPDKELRTIPITALHDGKHYIVEKYAISNTIGLTLVEPEQIKREQIDFLALGLSESVQGYPPLMSVEFELDGIKTLYGGTQLKDKSFVINSIEKELKKTSYAIVHIASHGVFTGDASENFILTWDSKLTMDNLDELIKMSKVRRENVEILALSACKTAAGDKDSALGLAGVAVKAGAKSALATLWHINDQASAELIIEFYKQLKDNQNTKADALQHAQMKLIKSRLYNHPYFWAPFILIGNWL